MKVGDTFVVENMDDSGDVTQETYVVIEIRDNVVVAEKQS